METSRTRKSSCERQGARSESRGGPVPEASEGAISHTYFGALSFEAVGRIGMERPQVCPTNLWPIV